MLKTAHSAALVLCLVTIALPLPGLAAEGGAGGEAVPSVENTVTNAILKDPRTEIVTLVYENDLIGSGKDGEYTSGVRLGYMDLNAQFPAFAHTLADFVPNFEINDTSSIFYSLGQNIFSPRDITLSPTDSEQRPYAGFLYGSIGMVTVTDDHSDEVELTLGVVGPASLAENTQKFIHRHVTDSPLPKGWGAQLHNEPGLMLAWQRAHPAALVGVAGPLHFSATPHYGVTLGNIYTFANAGFNIQLRPDNGALQDTPVRVRPAMPGSGYFDIPEKKWGWYLFAGVDGRALARNIFLDGNTFRDSASVDKNHFVFDSNAGLALTYDKYRISYTIVHRTKEFTEQDEAQVFGVITLGHRF
jgi:lipid A 3-O-deacylase